MPEPHTHLYEVEVETEAAGASLDFVMPAWTPGSYLMREFAGQVEGFHAEDERGAPLPWAKQDKCSWRVITDPARGPVRIRYRVHANELTVRTSHLDASHGFVNGTGVFMYVAGRGGEPVGLAVDAPPGWRVVTELDGDGTSFRAEDYDHLADSPLEIGRSTVVDFDIDGIPHRYAFWGEGNWHRERLIRDTTRIVRANRSLFGALPYDRFTFIVHLIPGGRGGLEHRDSTVLQADPRAFEGSAYERFLGLLAHEHFHVWNGKRIRPAPLGPFDYTRENYTRNLWVVEGLTTYYTERGLLWSGTVTPERHLERLSKSIDHYLSQPGRCRQTLAESSFDAWIKLYRPNAHAQNSRISYYLKGALVGLVLDLRLREMTGGARSLDDVMRVLWERYGVRDRGFPEASREGIEPLVNEVAGTDLSDHFDRWIRSTEELELGEALETAGLRLHRPMGSGAPSSAADVRRCIDRHLGLRIDEDSLRVNAVRAGTPAHDAGINADDLIVSVDGWAPDPLGLAALAAPSQETVRTILVERRGRHVGLEMSVPPGPIRGPLQIERVPDPTPGQARRLGEWMAPRGGTHGTEAG